MGSLILVIRAALGASVATDRARTVHLHTCVLDGACDHHGGDAWLGPAFPERHLTEAFAHK